MTSYELSELFTNFRNDVNKLCGDKDWDRAMVMYKKWEKTTRPYLDTCAFTCDDYKEREAFNIQARSDACNGYLKAESAGGKEHYVKLYNNASNELYSLWFSWKPFINQMKQDLDACEKYIRINLQEDAKNKKS